MGKFRNTTTGVVVSVDDSKDGRFVNGYEPASEAAPKKSEQKAPAKKAAAAEPAKK